MTSNYLSTEVIQHLYGFLTLQDVLSLSRTSKHYHMSYIGHQLPILQQAVYNSYGPVHELKKLVRSDERDTRSKILSSYNCYIRDVNRVINTPDKTNMSLELIIKMVQYGSVVDKWVEIYPRLRWREDSNNRRLLRPHEQERLRRAAYHYWTYNNIFHHCPFYAPIDYSLSLGDRPRRDDPRLRLLRTYTTLELLELAEFFDMMQQLIEIDLYPSNFTISDQYARLPSPRALENIAWGDNPMHKRLVLDLLKYNPRDLLFLVEKTSKKSERLAFLISQGKFFADSPATLKVAVQSVIYNRYRFSLYWFKNISITDLADTPDYTRDSKWASDASPTGAWENTHFSDSEALQSEDTEEEDSEDG